MHEHKSEHSEVNTKARRERHHKLFIQNRATRLAREISKANIFFKYLFSLVFNKLQPKKSSLVNEEIEVIVYYRHYAKRLALLTLAFVFLNSFNIQPAFTYSEFEEGYWGFENEAFDTDYLSTIVSDDEGYLLKTVPTIEEGATYLNREEIIVIHKVQENQTLSQIATMYGLEMQTILWANNISNPNNLTIGMKINIPKTDGVIHKVKQGETVDKIAAEYKADVVKIREQNVIKEDLIQIGQILIIPGARPIIKAAPKYIASKPKETGGPVATPRKGIGDSAASVAPPASEAVIASGGKMTFPTTGKITQGYNRNHLALDIANRDRPGVWAARAGSVIVAEYSGWNGGYGKNIIIDHGDGIQTLYAHLDQVYVQVGESVTEGQVIGKMGNTGRVYGVTGIHLHFEVRVGGRRLNPWNYL